MELVCRHVVGLIAVLVFVAAPALAQSTAPPAEKDGPSIYDKIWGRFTNWYDSKDSDVVQRVLFSGRLHYEFSDVNADQGEVSEWNVRRMRFGPRITLFRNYTMHVEVEVNPQEHDPFYDRLTDAYIAWSTTPKVVVTAGKQSVPFTGEGATSSRELITIDRSPLANNIWFTEEYMTGLSVSGRTSPWTYRAGIYSAGAENGEFGEFNGGLFTLGILGYDFSGTLGVREASVTGNYVYQQADVNNTATRPFDHIVSIHWRLEEGRIGMRGDVSMASGYFTQPDLWAVMAAPYFNVTPKLQIVGRYTFVESDRVNGVRLGTYENRVVTSGRGDKYSEGYLGASYYFYGHRLKLQTGLHFGEMTDAASDGGAYSGTSWVTGLRIGW
jgi:phosphate-selective porin OprO and OprP